MSYPNITQDIQELQAFQANLINLVYPVGSIYMSVDNVSPATFLGGTWTQIKDRFLLSAGSSYSAGSTGGEASHTLSISEIPSHSHLIRHNREDNGGYVPANAYAHAVQSGSETNGNTGNGLFTDRIRDSDVWSGSGFNQPTGGSLSHNNMPPYLTVYMWKRTA
jgi:hypothetical protein